MRAFGVMTSMNIIYYLSLWIKCPFSPCNIFICHVNEIHILHGIIFLRGKVLDIS